MCWRSLAVVKFNPMKLAPMPWVEGYVLDYHTISSTPTGDPYYRFDTKRTDLGELLFRFKYRSAGTPALNDIVDTVEQFVRGWKPPIECIVPAPASVTRRAQPGTELARGLAARLLLPVFEGAVAKVKATAQMKNIDDWVERQRLLEEAIQVGKDDVRGKCILLVDDLIESGSTLRRAAEVLLKDAGARAVYALVLTRTK
jgi:predicted amidophosphoribosyltransferase